MKVLRHRSWQLYASAPRVMMRDGAPQCRAPRAVAARWKCPHNGSSLCVDYLPPPPHTLCAFGLCPRSSLRRIHAHGRMMSASSRVAAVVVARHITTHRRAAGRSNPMSFRCSGEMAPGSWSGVSGGAQPAMTNSCGQWLVLTDSTNPSRRRSSVSGVASRAGVMHT